ncbi:hypothetical protein RI367_000218 [Sorochytrium milnesiophthora]
MAPTYKLYYFNFTGMAEVARLTLVLAGADWDNALPTVRNWKEEKDKTPFGQVPVLIIREGGEETHLAQSQAITRYIAARHDIAPRDELQRALADSVTETITDFRAKLLPVALWLEGDELEQAKKEMRETVAPAFIKYMTRILQQNGSRGIFVGDKIGVPELSLYYLMSVTPEGVPGSFTHENAPEVVKVYEAVHNNERIKAYLNSSKRLKSLIP